MEYNLPEMNIRLADIVPESVVDGKGIRMTVFVQGCEHRCKGCHNQGTWPMDGGEIKDIGFIADLAEKDPLLDGLTLSGGEPFLQPAPLYELSKWCHSRGLNVWCYSGFTYEQLLEMGKCDENVKNLLGEIDVLVDGPFIEAQKDLTLVFRGSSNQRVIDLNKTRETGEVTLLSM